MKRMVGRLRLPALLALLALLAPWGCDDPANLYYPDEGLDFQDEPRMSVAPKTQSDEDVKRKSEGCMSCHKGIENPSMHASPSVKLGCVDCHGGNGQATTLEAGHVQPRGPWYYHSMPHDEPHGQAGEAAHAVAPGEGAAKAAPAQSHAATGGTGAPAAVQAPSSRNPLRTGEVWQKESAEFIRFVNPGDLRVSKYSCGECHAGYHERVTHSMMSHSAMLWGAALYNNGVINQKYARFGEAYTFTGRPGRLQSIEIADDGSYKVFRPTQEDIINRGILPFLDPLPRYNIAQSGNILRPFERGGRIKSETAIPDSRKATQPFLNEPGRPEFKLSVRGFGTNLSTDPVFLGLQKTRLVDPMLWHLGTNDQAGDYRSSGCTACHAIYANDRDPAHSGPYAKYGNQGHSFSEDATLKHIQGKESGHPIKHLLTKAIPSSQCIVCHIHPGTTVTMTYYGNLWWDNESEGKKMYPPSQARKLTEEEAYKIKKRNPEGAALRGNWGDQAWLEKLYDRNAEFKQVQFADYHGHGWIFRNIYKQDRKGNLLDHDNKVVPPDSPDKFKKGEKGEPLPGSAVHLQDIHLEKGMHCIDCHFGIDNHGNGKLYGEVRNATEINCIDCHGSVSKKASLKTSGNAAPAGGTDLAQTQTAFGKRFRWVGDKLMQQSAVNADQKWEVPQVVDVINPNHPRYSPKARWAKTIRKDNQTWGDVPADTADLAHRDGNMDCYVCHTSWMASCFGCHLPMSANQKRKNNHFEGGKSRNWTQYNFQTLREDVFMLGKDGKVKGGKVAPVRSACAVIVGSQNANRDWIYSQQQTVSAEGFSGQAFSPHFPHAVRGKGETKTCSDCHLSEKGDNNAWMSQLLMLGTNLTNFTYRLLYVSCKDGGLSAVTVTEREEPQAVIGSTLHRDAFPEAFAEHQRNGLELSEAHHHPGKVLGAQLRGEYVYAARGGGGLTIYDVANVDNKDFSERIVTAPVSPLGQRLYVKSEDCTSVISPTVLGVDPTRQPPLRPRDPLNQEQAISLVYAFLYCTDRKEGLFTTLAATLLDGDPTNNYLERHLTFNPDGILNGAVSGRVAGNHLYLCCDKGLAVVDLSKIGTELVEAALKLNPKGDLVLPVKKILEHARKPDPSELKVVGVVPLNKPKAVMIQFRYAFVLDADGLKVVDITDPQRAHLVEGAFVPFKDGRGLYVARTYAYVAGGAEGLGIVDIEQAEKPKLFAQFTADGKLNDLYDVKIGMTNNSAFAYLANGKNGLAVVQLTSPESVPGYLGWSPQPKPVLIATKHLHGDAVNISEGLMRDRAVDESGNQLSVFNRVGARPFNKEEMERMYKREGAVFTVGDEPKGEPKAFQGSGGGAPDAELQKQIQELEEQLNKERNPIKKRKLQQDLEGLKKKAAESAAAGGGNAAKIQELEEQIKKERNPAKRNQLKKELETLKGGQ